MATYLMYLRDKARGKGKEGKKKTIKGREWKGTEGGKEI